MLLFLVHWSEEMRKLINGYVIESTTIVVSPKNPEDQRPDLNTQVIVQDHSVEVSQFNVATGKSEAIVILPGEWPAIKDAIEQAIEICPQPEE